MRINIFDNGLNSRSGHHFDYCLNVATCFVQKGYAVTVCGTQSAELEIAPAFAAAGCAFLPLFSHFAYAPMEVGNDIVGGVNAFALTAASEMARVARADLNVFLTLKPLEYYAFSLLESVAPTVGLVHAEPNFQGRIVAHIWSQAVQNVTRTKVPLALGALDPVIGGFLATYSGRQAILDFPNPIDGSPRNTYRSQLRTVGFFGHQRSERGLEMIPPMVDRLLALGYEVVVHDTMGQLNAGSAIPGLRLLSKFVDDLGAEMAQCDLVICPMQSENYIHRMSGVVSCAMASGVPLVLPAGTLSSMRCHPFGSSASYIEHSVEGILQAVKTVAANYPSYAEGAKSGAQYWRDNHGVERFVDRALQEILPS